MKTHFKSTEIAHVWANQSAPMGRSPGAMSFNGECLLSYSTVIARIINYKGKRAFVFDTYGFSVSTSKHQGRARCAVPSDAQKFFVNCGQRGQSLNFTPAELRDYYLAKFNRELPVEKLAHKNAANLSAKYSWLEKAIEVCKFFGLACVALENKAAKIKPQVELAWQQIAEREAKLKASRELREQTRKAKITASAIAAWNKIESGQLKISEVSSYKMKLALPDDLLAKFESAQVKFEAEKIQRWQAGESVHLDYSLPAMVRRESDELVTSKGARVPISEAEKAFRFASIRKAGWHKNGERLQVGNYELDAVNESGIVAGCHRISWDEINRFAKSENWI